MRREDVRNALMLTVLAALVRFPTLGLQSFDHDEAVTVGLVLHPSLVDTLRPGGGETRPPLFYVLEWFCSKLFGSGEVAMRLISALAGTATAPVVYELEGRWPRGGSGWWPARTSRSIRPCSGFRRTLAPTRCSSSSVRCRCSAS